MDSYPTRAEKRDTELYIAAEKGNLELEGVIVYPSEMTKLEKEGFRIFNVKPYSCNAYLYSVTVSWVHAFGDGIPLIVYSYIHNIIDTMPKNQAQNFAQELFLVAHRHLRTNHK